MCSLTVEGVGRQTASSIEFARYLTMAIGSAEEARAMVSLCERPRFVEERTAKDWRDRYGQILRMLMKLRASVQQRSDH